jgi:hypothetical protein
MIATRQIMKVENRRLVLDIGDDYEALMNRDVEILIFPCPEESERFSGPGRQTSLSKGKFQSCGIKTKGFRFDREEANAR